MRYIVGFVTGVLAAVGVIVIGTTMNAVTVSVGPLPTSVPYITAAFAVPPSTAHHLAITIHHGPAHFEGYFTVVGGEAAVVLSHTNGDAVSRYPATQGRHLIDVDQMPAGHYILTFANASKGTTSIHVTVAFRSVLDERKAGSP